MVANAPNATKAVNLNLEEEKISRKRPSETCLHCDFRSDSPTVLTQHLWENHPLRMRRKQHLFKSSNVKHSKSVEIANEANVKDSVNCNSPTINKLLSQGSDNTDESSTNVSEAIKERSQGRAKVEGRSLIKDCGDTAKGSASNEQSSRDSQQNNLKNYQNIVAKNNCQYDSRGVYVAEQFMSIPFATSSGVIHQVAIPIQSNQLDSYALNAFTKVYLANAMNLQYCQNKLNANNSQDIPISSNYSFQTPPASTSSNMNFAHQPIVPISNSKSSSTNKNDCNPNTLINLVQRNNDPAKQNWKYRATNPRQQGGKTKYSNKTTIPDNLKPKKSQTKGNSLIDNARMEALEEAMRSVCFYDVNDTSSVMPFKCPDNIWRMVRFKCIQGVWLVQLPDSDNPTLYVPLKKSQEHQSSLRSALEKSRANKNINPQFNQYTANQKKDVDCQSLGPNGSKKRIDMFTNVERSEVKAKRIQSTVKSGNVLRSLLVGGSCKSGLKNHNISNKIGAISPYASTLCKKTMVDAKVY